jgi:hypothetical protein
VNTLDNEITASTDKADNPEHGDKGERLANLKAWARGEDSYVKLGKFSSRDGS